jgi:hypothetical protein
VTALRGTPLPVTTLAVTDETAPAVAAVVLAGTSADPRVAALCRWAIAVDVAGLRRDLAAARAEAALAREDFHRLRALRDDHVPAPEGGSLDTIDEDYSDAVPIALPDRDTERSTAPRTVRLQRPAVSPLRVGG